MSSAQRGMALAAGVALGAAMMAAGCAPSPVRTAPEEKSAMAGPRVSEVSASDATDRCVNGTCPVTGTACADVSPRNAALTRRWNGKVVAFCCEDCPNVWDHMSEAQRREAMGGKEQ